MSSIVIQGDTSGSITVEAPSVAGTHTLTLPKATGDIATTAQSSVGQKNLIINGDMRIAQRGTSTAGVTSGGYNNIDRFGFYVSTGGTWTVSQDTDAPTGQGFTRSQKLDCTTANASLSSGSYIIYEQKIEAQNLQHLKFGTASAESLTLSFWVKSNKTGTYTLDLYVEDGTSQLSYTYTIDSANTWEKKTVTIQGNTSNSINNDNGEGFRIDWWLGAGTDFNSGTFNTSSWQTRVNANRVSPSQVNLADSTSNYINITGVQLEVGENATPFENRSYGTELALCQRYYTKSYNILTAPGSNTTIGEEYFGLGAARSNNYGLNMIYYNGPTMRTNATVSIYSVSGTSGQISNGDSGVNIGGGSVLYASDKKFMIQNTTGGTIADGSYISFHWTASAEL